MGIYPKNKIYKRQIPKYEYSDKYGIPVLKRNEQSLGYFIGCLKRKRLAKIEYEESIIDKINATFPMK